MDEGAAEAAGLKLPPEARAASLLESLDDEDDEEAESVWSAEIARRIEELDSGQVKTVRWSEARKMILGSSDGRG